MQLPSDRTRWVQSKAVFATSLSHGDCNGSYRDAALILCVVLSSLATEVWPRGRQTAHLDKKRFVQLLVDYSPDHLHLTRISIPSLILSSKLQPSKISTISTGFDDLGQSTRILNGNDVDRDEITILTKYPRLTRGVVRRSSYACILYEWIRSGYVHEYSEDPRASAYRHTHAVDSDVNYLNTVEGSEIVRKIHFPIPWLCSVAIETAHNLDNLTLPLPPPTHWWIDG